ncbi:MAG: DsbA family protein [Sinobacterium sp.]|nr:DsbA family protein [Sinobacterium sp.]
MSAQPLVIDYYSDVLCVWAWIAQKRIDELNQHFADKIEFRHFCIDIFGHVEKKMADQWASKGGIKGFAEHVQHSLSGFEDVVASPDIWQRVQPSTSANAHLVLKAVEAAYSVHHAEQLSLAIRQAFFIDALDISDLQCLMNVVETEGLNVQLVQQQLNEGGAIALLMRDLKQASALGVKGSPTYILDGGRQMLYGNVGYRVLKANIEELLNQPEHEASWC